MIGMAIAAPVIPTLIGILGVSRALMMVIAVVWFVGGLAADIIFFYPPVLFIVGLVAFFKGLAGGES